MIRYVSLALALLAGAIAAPAAAAHNGGGLPDA